MFYSLAAEAHPGQDGAPRKAILRYQDPVHPYSYPPQPVPFHDDAPTNPTYYAEATVPSHVHPYSFPPTAYDHSQFEAEPAQFANAGPPGYSYNPASSRWEYSANRWSTGSDEQACVVSSSVPPAWRTRSEWSSPMPGFEGWHPHLYP